MSDACERDFCMAVVRCVEELSDEEFSSLCYILDVSQQVRDKRQTRAGILQYLKEHGKISSERPEDFVEVLAKGLQREELAKRMRRLTEKPNDDIHTVQPSEATNTQMSSAATPSEEYTTPGLVQFRQRRDEKVSSAAKRQGIHIQKSTDDLQTDSDGPYHTLEDAAEQIFAPGPNYSPNTVVAKLFMDYMTSEDTWVVFAEQARNILYSRFFTYMHAQNKTGEASRTTAVSESSMPASHFEFGPVNTDPEDASPGGMMRQGSIRSKRSSGYNSMLLEPVPEELEPLAMSSVRDHSHVSVASPGDQMSVTGDESVISVGGTTDSHIETMPFMESSGLDVIQAPSITKIVQQMRIKQSDIQKDITSTHKQRIYKSQPFTCAQDTPQLELQFHPRLGHSSLYVCMTGTDQNAMSLRRLLPMDIKVSVLDSGELVSSELDRRSCISFRHERLESIRLSYTAQHCIAAFPTVVSHKDLQSAMSDSVVIQVEFEFEWK